MTTVLVVEPDASLKRLMRWILREAGYATVGAYDLDHALGALAGVQPDVTLLDGDELTDDERADEIAVLRTRWPGAGVIDVRHLGMGATPAADLTLTKPFHAESLVAAVDSLSAGCTSLADTAPDSDAAAELGPEDG